MKRIDCLLSLIVFVGCTQMDFEMEQGFNSLQANSFSKTRVISETDVDSITLRDSIYKEFFVPYVGAKIYAAIHCGEESYKELDTIVPMTDGIDTLMYLIQYKKGWDVIAADKRGPLVIAMSEDGRFESDDTLSGFSAYLDVQMQYLKAMRSVVEDNKVSDAYTFWSMIHPQNTSVTRDYGSGYWELYDSESEAITAESGHMIQTKWGQGSPWDTFVPYNKDKPNEQCAVGCTAVSGAQMLYYLHYKLGCPQAMYTTGGCVGHNESYSYSFSNATAEAWDNMALKANDYSTARKEQAALLMAYVGCAIDMKYGELSGKRTKFLQELFDKLGISSTYEDYNSATAWESLKNGMPVIIGAKALIDEYPYIVGHSWIMDGWKTITIKQTAYYGWVDSTWQDFKPVDGVDPIAPTLVRPDDMIKYKDFKTITNSYKSNYVLMNWGWDGRYDDIYCTLDGAWAPDPEVSLQYSRKMIHGFGLK